MIEYISGYEALNIPNERRLIADWHPLLYINPKKSIKLYKANDILKNKGIIKRFIPELQNYFHIASFPRAIADLVWESENLSSLKNMSDDFLDNKEKEELFELLKIINQYKDIKSYIKQELTLIYFREHKKC